MSVNQMSKISPTVREAGLFTCRRSPEKILGFKSGFACDPHCPPHLSVPANSPVTAVPHRDCVVTAICNARDLCYLHPLLRLAAHRDEGACEQVYGLLMIGKQVINRLAWLPLLRCNVAS